MERSRLLLYLGLWDSVQKAMKVAEREQADAYAGPNKSFPLYVDGKHLASAWNLAGHADDPQEVRRNILAFAKKHNLMHFLPLDAQHSANVMEVTRKSFEDGEWPDIDAAAQALTAVSGNPKSAKPIKTVKKAASGVPSDMDPGGDADMVMDAADNDNADDAEDDLRDDQALRQLLEMAMNHEVGEGDSQQFERLRAFAHANGLDSLLPQTAAPAVQKAAAPEASKAPEAPQTPQVKTVVVEDEGIPVAKSMLVTKSWSDARTGDVFIEGWVSTEARDQQKDIVPPEAFSSALPEYMARYAPLTTEHRLYPNIKKGQLEQYPVGHMQRIALVRDGQVLQEAVHPTDPAEFEHFPGFGTGAYGRGVINDNTAATQVVKGNMAGFSWVGRLKEYDLLPDGGKRYNRIEPWLETTLSAFPVNSTARLVAQGRAKSNQEE